MRKLLLLVVLVLLFSWLIPTVPAFASEEELKSYITNTSWYKAGGSAAVCTVSPPITLNGNDKIEQAYNFFVGKGLTPAQSAGILGNINAESSFDPHASNGSHFGIAQWDSGRWGRLEKFAAEQGKDKFDFGLQLEFIWWEFNNTEQGAFNALKATTTVEDATNVINNKYERSGGAASAKRLNFARAVLAKYGGQSATIPVSNPTALPGNTCSGVTGNGQDTQFIDNFTIYSQGDPSWKDKPFGSSTIGEAGCGPASMAMIITNLTGNQVTPDVTAKYAGEQNLYVPGAGSSWSIAPVLAEHWGLKATPIGASVAAITATLQAGGLVAAPGKGATPYTPNGHYIVIRGVTASGKWKIGDPGHRNTNTQEWDPAQLAAQMSGGGVYAITK